MSDEELVRRVGARDKAAYDLLYSKYRPRLVWYFRQELGAGMADPEDLAATVMEVVWKTAAEFRGEGKGSAWIFGIARNKAHDAHRKRGREEPADDDEPLDPPAPGSDPSEYAHWARLGETVLSAFLQLSAKHREVLEQVYVYDRSMEEIARRLEIPKGTVQTRALHARRNLYERLTEMGVTPEDITPPS